MSFSSLWKAHNRWFVGALGLLVIVVGLVAVVNRVDPPIASGDLSTLSSLPAQDVEPRFEIVRMNQNGSAVFSGVATPGATVTLRLNGEHLASTEVDIEGDWVYTSAEAFQPGQHVVHLVSNLKGFADSRTDELLLIDLPRIDTFVEDPTPNETVMVTAYSRENGMRILQRPGLAQNFASLQPVQQQAETVVNDPEPVAVVDTTSIPAPTTEEESTSLTPIAQVVVNALLHQPEDNSVTIEGVGEPNGRIRAEVEGNPAREALIDSSGKWRVTLASKGVVNERKRLTIVQFHDGQEANRQVVQLDTPAQPATTETEPATPQATEGRTVKVQRGDSLWIVAKRAYGDGTQYKKLLAANKDQLKSHRDLKPGMVLRVP